MSVDWATPKTDWTAANYYNVADYNRAKNNFTFLLDAVLPLMGYVKDYAAASDLTEYDKPSYANLNAIEAMIGVIAGSGVSLPSGWLPPVTWSDALMYPDYTDANRWERNAQLIYNLFDWGAAPAGYYKRADWVTGSSTTYTAPNATYISGYTSYSLNSSTGQYSNAGSAISKNYQSASGTYTIYVASGGTLYKYVCTVVQDASITAVKYSYGTTYTAPYYSEGSISGPSVSSQSYGSMTITGYPSYSFDSSTGQFSASGTSTSYTRYYDDNNSSKSRLYTGFGSTLTYKEIWNPSSDNVEVDTYTKGSTYHAGAYSMGSETERETITYTSGNYGSVTGKPEYGFNAWTGHYSTSGTEATKDYNSTTGSYTLYAIDGSYNLIRYDIVVVHGSTMTVQVYTRTSGYYEL